MKNLKLLLSFSSLMLLVIFTACQKEKIEPFNTKTIAERVNTPAAPNSLPTCRPTWSFARDHYSLGKCAVPDFTLCTSDFSPFPTDDLEINQATGTAYVNSEEELVLDFDRVNFDQAVLEDILSTRTFTVEEAVEFPHDMISPLFEEAGFSPLEEPFVFQRGNYPVILEGNVSSGTTVKQPKKVKIKYYKNGKIKKVKIRY